MLLRNFLDNLNARLVGVAIEILDATCIDKSNNYTWNYAIDVRDSTENSSIMLLNGKFVTDTFIHKNYEVMFGVVREEVEVNELNKLETLIGLMEKDIQRIELGIKISIEFNLPPSDS